MKRYTLLLLVSLPLLVFAQTQKGYVRTAGSLNQRGLPLSDVSVKVSGDFNPTKSDTTGTFSITMPNFKNGTSSYALQSVYKKGFELCDKNFLGRKYPFSTEVPLEIVMISRAILIERQTEIEDRARANAEKKYHIKLDALNKQLDTHKITEKTYRKELSELHKQQESFDALISVMAERYARTDYDKLDSLNKVINACIIEGNLNKADSLINSKGNIEKRMADCLRREGMLNDAEGELQRAEALLQSQKKETAQQKEDLAQDLYNKHSISLSNFKIDTAAYYIKLRAELDTMNWEYQINAGRFFNDYKANYQQAMSYYQRASSCIQAQESINDESTTFARALVCIGCIGQIYEELGDYKSALEAFKMALDAISKMPTAESTDIATSTIYGHIGSIYSSLGDYTSALKFQKEALEISNLYIETNLSETADRYNSIGTIYSSLRDYKLALEYQKKALETKRKIVNSDNPEMIAIYSNIGTTYCYLKDYSNALKFTHEALTISLKSYNTYHPNIATCYNNVAFVYNQQEDFKKALEFRKKALEIVEKALGTEHALVATIYQNISVDYNCLGDYETELKYAKRALSVNLKVFGPEHAKVAIGYQALGAYSYDQKDFITALDYFKKALVIQKKIFGSEHAITKESFSLVYLSYANIMKYTNYESQEYKKIKNEFDSFIKEIPTELYEMIIANINI